MIFVILRLFIMLPSLDSLFKTIFRILIIAALLDKMYLNVNKQSSTHNMAVSAIRVLIDTSGCTCACFGSRSSSRAQKALEHRQ